MNVCVYVHSSVGLTSTVSSCVSSCAAGDRPQTARLRRVTCARPWLSPSVDGPWCVWCGARVRLVVAKLWAASARRRADGRPW
jgi:hypothetical protein